MKKNFKKNYGIIEEEPDSLGITDILQDQLKRLIPAAETDNMFLVEAISASIKGFYKDFKDK